MKKYNTSYRLKQLMKERGIKQIDILNLAAPYCKKYGVKLNKNDLSQYVNGKVEPGQHKLFILSLALDVNEAWLMGFDEVSMSREAQGNAQEPKQLKNSFHLTDHEKEVIIAYRQKPHMQNAVDTLLSLPTTQGASAKEKEEA